MLLAPLCHGTLLHAPPTRLQEARVAVGYTVYTTSIPVCPSDHSFLACRKCLLRCAWWCRSHPHARRGITWYYFFTAFAHLGCLQEVPVEVRVEVPVPAPAAAAGGGSWQELVQALREHSSDIAHDMKNPLNGVLALSQNVLQVGQGSLVVW